MKTSQELREIAAQAGPFLEYMERQEEMKSASAELELHRSEFEEFKAKEERLAKLADTLFREERFASLRFTGADIKRAFDEVGYPAMMSPDDRTVETIRKAILLLATGAWRREAALR